MQSAWKSIRDKISDIYVCCCHWKGKEVPAFQLALPNRKILTVQVREPVDGFVQLLVPSLTTEKPGTGEITTE